MTEQEAIERIRLEVCNEGISKLCHDSCMYGKRKCAYGMAIDALEEIQKYKNIGVSSADELEQDLILHKADSMVLNEYKAIGAVEEIKKLVRFLSIDNDREIIKELEELRDYVSIGTVKECREARERQTSERPNIYGDGYDDEGNMIYDMYDCPNCGTTYEVDYEKYDFCPNCGQAIDWSDGE